MDTIRQLKIARLIQKEFSQLLQKELNHMCGKALVTVTFVRITADLQIAKIYLSIYNTPDKERVFQDFKANASEVRYILGQKLRFQLRRIPEIHFYLDDSMDFIERIDKLLKS